MNYSPLIFFSLLIFGACQKQQPNTSKRTSNQVIITGVSTMPNVRFEIYDIEENPLIIEDKHYVSQTNNEGDFLVKLDIDHLARIRFSISDKEIDLLATPGDSINIDLVQDYFFFNGDGGDRNNFLQSILHDNFSVEKFKSTYLNKETHLSLYTIKLSQLFALREKKMKKAKLKKEFTDYFLAEESVIHDQLLEERLALEEDHVHVPEEYKKVHTLEHVLNDKNIYAFDYIKKVRSMMYQSIPSIRQQFPEMKMKDAQLHFISDSLTGKTKEYVLAQWIYTRLTFNNYDSTAIHNFYAIAKEKLPLHTVEEAIEQYNYKQSLLGKALPKYFNETVLLTKENKEVKLEKVIKELEGKVVYLNIWSKSCSSCKEAQPYLANLKPKLAEENTVILNLSVDDEWEDVKQFYSDLDHHYLLKNGTDAELLKTLKINWMPNYMVIDTKGKLGELYAKWPKKLMEESTVEYFSNYTDGDIESL